MEPSKPKPKALKWTLIIGIAIVLNLFFNYSLSLVYPAPQYSSFCPVSQVQNPPETKAQCISVGGQWTENTFPEVKTVQTTPTTAPKQITVSGYCDPNYSCSQKYAAADSQYERTVFITLVTLGVAALLLGLLLRVSDAVTIGLSVGGVLSLLIASARYWSEAGNILKVIILGIALVALLWIGIKKFQD